MISLPASNATTSGGFSSGFPTCPFGLLPSAVPLVPSPAVGSLSTTARTHTKAGHCLPRDHLPLAWGMHININQTYGPCQSTSRDRICSCNCSLCGPDCTASVLTPATLLVKKDFCHVVLEEM